MALLDMLVQKPGTDLIVAHFNHGIRSDSKKDEELVEQTAEKLHLAFEVGYGNLGSAASEEQAREARYDFLNKVKKKHHASAIITAHHQDDLLETAILNIIRGSGRRGLSAIAENPDIKRPLLHWDKEDIMAYAKKHDLHWREDPTNTDEKYLRNYIRHSLMPKFSQKERQKLLSELNKITLGNRVINQEIANLSQNLAKDRAINRADFTNLPNEVANEVLMHFLRQNDVRDFNRKTIERLVVVVKTAKPKTTHDVEKGTQLKMTSTQALLTTTD